MRRLLTTLAVAAAVGGASASTAAAGSIVYTKDANVWIAADDGSSRYQVTTDGTADNPWQSPSQADDGTIVAARGKPNGGPLYVLRQNGDVVRRLDLPAMQFGPWDPAVSPDGRTVAYTHGFTRWINGYQEVGTDIRYARTDGSHEADTWRGVSTGATTPSWYDSTRTFVARGTLAYTQPLGGAPSQWWSDYDHWSIFGVGQDLLDGEVAGGRIALVRGRMGETLQLYRQQPGGGTPSVGCTISDPVAGPLGAKFADPTLSSDGRTLIYQMGDGLYVAHLPAPAEDECRWSVEKLVDGAGEPDWGPAPVNPGPRTAPPAPAPATAPAPSPGPAPAAPSTLAPTHRAASTPAAASPKAKTARCDRLTSKRGRATCRRAARRAAAAATCRRTKHGRALRRCLSKAARRR